MPDFSIEMQKWSKGLSRVAGVDEAGRGSWSGPVVAAAVVFDKKKYKQAALIGVNDSKKLQLAHEWSRRGAPNRSPAGAPCGGNGARIVVFQRKPVRPPGRRPRLGSVGQVQGILRNHAASSVVPLRRLADSLDLPGGLSPPVSVPFH